jgi:hypothetical protein
VLERGPRPSDHVLLDAPGRDLDGPGESASREPAVRHDPELTETEHVGAAWTFRIDLLTEPANRRGQQQAAEPATP